ncbi:PREDICTED: sperm flagellar protein 2-like [Nicrophorus vespilloides]|uniref:Sperm flagellar protein 2-like n=1 Tax=Nicrophorus vespilloides TaxID=110193 RepID=A0ABM1LZU0_NICVS|nr:PREDICTED: sperm flagellar protein 2-like [Nicrophorus vespilloides]
MSEIIRVWFAKQLGVIFGPDSWDGLNASSLLARLLRSYDLVGEFEVEVVETGNPEALESTLQLFLETINNLGIEFTKEEYRQVIQGKGSAATKLFFELYLALYDKEKLHVITSRKINQYIDTSGTRFSIESVKDEKEEQDAAKFDNPLAEPILRSVDIIDWCKLKMDAFMERSALARKAYLEHVAKYRLEHSENLVKNISSALPEPPEPKLPTIAPSLNQTIDELLLEEEEAKNKGCLQNDPKVAKKIMNTIRKRRRKEEARKELKVRFQKFLLKELWDRILNEQDEYFKDDFTKKMLKQSMYEQQMTTKMLEVRQQKDLIAENKFKMMEFIRSEEQSQFHAQEELENQHVDAARMNYYEEKQRNLELHRRLYAEKIARKAKKHYEICKQAMDDLIDISLYQSTYKEYCGEELSRRRMNDLANLFIKQQPIFNILPNVSDIISHNPFEHEDAELILKYSLEIERQNALDDMSFEEYCNNYWPWELCNIEDVDMQPIDLGMSILGYIVHRMLLAKYPKKPPQPPPQIVKGSVAACVNGIQNVTYLPALEQLLSARRIKVIQMEDAMNFCLEQFKTEATEEYFDAVFVKDTKKAVQTSARTSKSSDTGTLKGGKRKSSNQKKPETRNFDEKESQTPVRFPCEELVLSASGELGRIAFEMLNLGNSPNDHLLCTMFLEYLKTLTGIDGWVLVNYPQTIEQAAILEEILTSLPVPPITEKMRDSIVDIVDFEDREMEGDVDKFEAKRHSKLVGNPKPIEIPFYETYLTAYIEMKSKDGSDLDEAYFECFKEPQHVDILNKFYEDQGCKYTLYYQHIDFDTVNYVEAHWNELTTVTSQAVKVGNKKENPNKKKKSKKSSPKSEKSKSKKDKKEKKEKKEKKSKGSSKSSKKSGKGKKDGKGKGGQVGPIETDEKETQIPEPPEVVEEPEEEPEPEPKPGESNWIYVNLDIPEQFEVALATLWENMESTYMTDFKLLFFRRRIVLDTLIPYIAFVYNNMQDFIKRPDDKQCYLRDFQVMYNNLDDDMRDDDEVKAELHVRIEEFREKLSQLCDKRMSESEAERQRIIAGNFFTTILFELVNIFVTFIQLEIDRCSDTLQFLIDYYTAMVTKMPSEERPLEKIKLKLIPLSAEENSADLQPYRDYIESLLVNVDEEQSGNLPFQEALQKNAILALNHVETLQTLTQKAHQKLQNSFNPKSKGKGGKKDNSTKSTKFVQPDQEVKDRAAELIDEFLYSFNGELARTDLRIKLIVFVFNRELVEYESRATGNFHRIFEEIKERYYREIESVEAACGVFASATEAETKIQPELVFDQDNFFVKINSLYFESPLPEVSPLADDEVDLDGEHFTLKQLSRITNILFDLAPDGQIAERSFVFLLQDLLTLNAEDGKEPFVPELWTKLHPHKTHAFSNQMFLDSEYIDWKDFILYNLNVGFPDGGELQRLRSDFCDLDPDRTELVYDYQFWTMLFWFDGILEEDNARCVKDLLIRLYKVDENRVNYTAMLLAFCKDEEPMNGLVRAIELSLGKPICCDYETGNRHYMGLVKVKLDLELEEMRREEDKADTARMAEEFVGVAADEAVHKCTSTYLEDLLEEEQTKIEDYTIEEISLVDESYEVIEATSNITCMEECSTRGSQSIFTNLEQGFEVSERMLYTLDFDTLMNVIAVALPWCSKMHNVDGSSLRERLALIYECSREPEFLHIYSHHFLANAELQELISKIYRFRIQRPVEVIKSLLETNNQTTQT